MSFAYSYRHKVMYELVSLHVAKRIGNTELYVETAPLKGRKLIMLDFLNDSKELQYYPYFLNHASNLQLNFSQNLLHVD